MENSQPLSLTFAKSGFRYKYFILWLQKSCFYICTRVKVACHSLKALFLSKSNIQSGAKK